MKLKRALGFILMMMVVMLYGCGSGGDGNKPLKITSVDLGVSGVVVKIGAVVELPKFATASWSDGSETSVGIIWDKTTVDTSKKDSIVYTGTVAGWDGKLVYTVEVTENGAEYIVGARLISNTATVEPKSNFTLPTTAMVKWSIGTETEAEIKWDNVADTSKEGTYTFTGKVSGYGAGELTYTLIVKKGEIAKITKVYLPITSNTVRQNSTFTLPAQGKAVWSNGEITDIALTWDKAVDTSKEGITIYEATANGTTFKVQYSLTVGPGIAVPKSLTLDLETVTVDVDSKYELPTTGKVKMSDGVEKIVELKWNKTTVDTSKAGINVYVASYTENKVTVTKVMTVIVGGEVKIEKLTLPSYEVTVPAGTKYTLPATATAVYTDGTEAEVVLTWDKKVDTSKEAIYTFTGTAKETKQTVILKLTVGPAPVTITALSITTNKSTVLPGATFTLPAKGTATLSNTETKEVDLTWDKEVDTSKEGTYTFIGKTSGSILEVKYTLVVDADALPELQSLTITPAKASVAVNGKYTLPAKGTAVYTDGKTAEVTLIWDKKVDTSKEGTTVYTASYTENSKTVKGTFALTVTGDKTVTSFIISKVDDITGIGTVYTLPKTGTITYEDETTEEVTVTWDKSVNTTVAGKYTFTGTNATAGTFKVTFVLTVTTVDTPVLTLSDISNVKAGDTIEVAVNALFFTKTVAAIDVRLNYDTTMLKGLDDATMLVSGMKIVKHIGTEQDVSVVLDKPTVISGTLFKVKFKVLKDGKTSIKFASGTEFLTSSAEKITMDTTDTGEVGAGIIEDNSTLTLSDWTGTTNDTAEVTVKAEGFKETSLGFDIILNYDTKYLTSLKDVTIVNSDLWKEMLIVTEPSAGKVKISVTTNKALPIVLSGDLFKVSFKSTGVVTPATTGTTVSFGEVRVANSTDGYQNSVTTIDTANVVVTQGEIITTKGTFEIADAKGTYPGTATVVLSGKGFTETASGVEFIVNYDSNYLEVENVSTDVTPTGVLAAGRIIPIVTTAGKLKIAVEIDNKTFTANGDLVIIKFKTKKDGKSALSFANVDLGNVAASGKMEATITDTATVTVEPVVVKAASVELTASSTSIEPNGTATLTAVVKDESGNAMSSEVADIYNGTTKAGSKTYAFTTATEGTYTFTAKLGTLTSTAVTVTVKKIPPQPVGGPYATNAVGVGKSKTITIDGALSDWSNDMLIAQGAAWDIANNWKGGHENCVLDSYSLYAAWDDTNLYIAWQMVNTTDTWASSGSGPLSDGGRVLDVPLIIALNTGKKTAMTGKMASGKLLWDALQLEFKTPVDHLFLMSGKVGLGTPAMFTAADATGGASYTAPYCQNFKATGIKYAMAMDALPAKIMMLEGSKAPTDVTSSTATWVDALTKGHVKTYDSFYEMSIPLSVLGIDKAYIESNGIGTMQIATRGVSAIDSLPHDATTLDNALGDCAVDPSSSHEKDDTDTFTVPLAKIGKK